MPLYAVPDERGGWSAHPNPTKWHGQLDQGGNLTLVMGPPDPLRAALADGKGGWRKPQVGVQLISKRSLDPNAYNWGAPIVLNDDSSITPYLQGDGSLYLHDVYPRNYNGAAIRNNTNRPLTVERSGVWSRINWKAVDAAIFSGIPGTPLVIRDVAGFSRKVGVSGMVAPRFFTCQYGTTKLIVENSYEDGLAGGSCLDSGSTATTLIRLVGRKIKNLDGRIEDTSTSDGFRHTNNWGGSGTIGFTVSQALQLVKVRNVAAFQVSDWEVENFAGQSRFEDLISNDSCTGSLSVPWRYLRLLLIGAYTYDWAYDGSGLWGNHMPQGTGGNSEFDENGRYKDARGYGNSGGLGMIADGDQYNYNSTDISWENCTAIASSNYSLAINGGQRHGIKNCTILASGMVHHLPGVQMSLPGWLPCQIDDSTYGAAGKFGGIVVSGNDVGMVHKNPWDASGTVYGVQANGTGGALSGGSTGITYSGNTTRSSVSQSDEQAAIAAHRTNWQAQGIVPGLLT